MAGIKLRDHESIESALKRFKRECDRDGIMQEIKRREFYESPPARKKRKFQELRRKMKKRFRYR